MGESEFFGVYLNAELVTSAIALVLNFLLHRILLRIGVHRRLWHPAVFETASFIVLWGVVLAFSRNLFS